MGSLLLNDIIVRLYPPQIRFERDLYERLCGELYDYYDTQSRSAGSYRFSHQRGGSCLIDGSHIRLTEYFSGQSVATVIEPMVSAAEQVYRALAVDPIKGYDVQISARLPQKELASERRINFLSSDEYIGARFLQDIDYGPLQGDPSGVGMRFLYARNGRNYDLRVEPYFKDRTYLFLDIGIQYADGELPQESLRQQLLNDVQYFETNVVSFIAFDSSETKVHHSDPAP